MNRPVTDSSARTGPALIRHFPNRRRESSQRGQLERSITLAIVAAADDRSVDAPASDTGCDAALRTPPATLLESTANMPARLPFIALLAAAALTTADAHADDVQRREDQFKAAYLINFVKFVEWPANPASDTLTVCFLGGEGVHEALASGINAKRVGARKLAARRVDQPTALASCDVLYVDAALVETSLATGLPVLTVSDAPQFATHGGMIELFTENHRLRFVINVANAQRAGLRISSDLLKLAASVRREER